MFYFHLIKLLIFRLTPREEAFSANRMNCLFRSFRQVFGQAVQSPFTISVPTISVFPFSSFGEYQEKLLSYTFKKSVKIWANVLWFFLIFLIYFLYWFFTDVLPVCWNALCNVLKLKEMSVNIQ